MKWLYILLFPILIFSQEIVGNQENISSPDEEIQIEHKESQQTLSSDVYKKQFYRTFVLIFIIVVGSFLLIWLVRKFAKDRPFQVNHKKNIKILERRQISPNTYLYHLQIGTKQVIISESKYEVRVITNLDWDQPDPPG